MSLDEIRVIPRGGQWARAGRTPARDFKHEQVRVHTFDVTRRMPNQNSNPRWELTCSVCHGTRQVNGSAISAFLRGERSITACGCATGRTLDQRRCLDKMGLSAPQLEVMMMVMALYRTEKTWPERRRVEKLLKRDIETQSLVRMRYLKQEGYPSVLIASDKTWQETGFSKRSYAETDGVG